MQDAVVEFHEIGIDTLGLVGFGITQLSAFSNNVEFI